jgi:anti-sigma regulatory factor (Ser/Thr protein kinase)
VADPDEPGPHFRPPCDAPAVELPFRLHADMVEELLERLPPLLDPPTFDARHVREAEPCALLTLTLLAASHGVEPPCLPVPHDPLIHPVRLGDAAELAAFLERVGGAEFLERLAGWGWSPADARRAASIAAELARNAVEHGGAAAWAAAWRCAGELRIAVADSGMGFGGSLGMADEQDALLRGLVHGTSRRGGRRRGGLRRVSALVAGLGGTMRVRSRTVVVSGAPTWQDPAVRSQLPFLPGVQVEVALPSPRRTPGPGG